MLRSVVVFAFVGFVVDRILKSYAQGLPEGTAFSFFPGLKFGYFLNPALFFFPAWRFIPWLALLVLIALLSFVIWNFIGNCAPKAHPPRVEKLEIGNSYHRALSPILLGGMSNVFDRFAYGGVIDYVNILSIATINLADILIFTGLLIIILPVGRQVSQTYVKRS